jgi:hypothetical protein
MRITLTDHTPEPDRYEPCFTTDDPGMLNIVKAYLEANDMKYLISGEDLLHLSGGALPIFHNAATIYILRRDFGTFYQIMESQVRTEL